MTVKNDAFAFWKMKELEAGKPIEVKDIAKETGLHHDTVAKLLTGQTTRLDLNVLDKICQYFKVPDGPIPFIVFQSSEGE